MKKDSFWNRPFWEGFLDGLALQPVSGWIIAAVRKVWRRG